MDQDNFGHATDQDFIKLFQDAMSRWLRPSEVYKILINNCKFFISKEPLNLPPSGTLVLFDRKMLRNFRSDGHPWRKKKDNKTTMESHERLKVGREEKLHVYYARGDGDSNLQRRVYWLLDKSLEDIVLVHYLEIKEVKMTMNLGQSTIPVQIMQNESYNLFQTSTGLNFKGINPLQSSENIQTMGQTKFGCTPLGSEFSNHRISGQPEQVNQQDGGNSDESIWKGTPPMVDNPLILFDHVGEHYPSASCMEILHPCIPSKSLDGGQFSFQDAKESQMYASERNYSITTVDSFGNNNQSSREKFVSDISKSFDLSSLASILEDSNEAPEKLDILDELILPEFPVDNKTSPLDLLINSLSVGTTMHEEKTLLHGEPDLHSQPEEETPLLKPQLFFDITDYSPTWGFSTENTKVIVTGHLDGSLIDFDKMDWCCMFGNKEVQMECVQMGVLKFTTPKDIAPGSVSFYISNGIKQPCSDMKQFEIKQMIGMQQGATDAKVGKGYENAVIEHKLAHLLLNNDHRNKTLEGLASIHPEFLKIADALEEEWAQLDTLLDRQSVAPSVVKDRLLRLILKILMIDSACKGLEMDTKTWQRFNSSGQNVLHLASALGYECVLSILKVCGMSIDFRDKQGWTALHWAACYGREKMVASLLAAGAKPGAISDPTPGHKLGYTPADVASLAGHKGLAGYLSEQNLASHRQNLTLAENDRDKQSASDEGYRVVKSLQRSMSLRQSIETSEDELALKDSLFAIGNATISSARIHAAFRQNFMIDCLHSTEKEDKYWIFIKKQTAIRKIQRAYRNHREKKKKEYAALKIQNQFRGWKTRKSFLKMRQNAIKIQACFRMQRARKQYHKVIWSVGVLEKAVLRWRQKGKGLRGYRPKTPIEIEGKDNDEFLQIGRKQAEEALNRAVLLVQSMVRSKFARQQYRKMKENFERAKAGSVSF